MTEPLPRPSFRWRSAREWAFVQRAYEEDCKEYPETFSEWVRRVLIAYAGKGSPKS